MMKTETKYGLTCGFVIVAYSTVTMYVTGDISKLTPAQFKSFESIGYIRYLLLLFTLYLALREARKKDPEAMTFGRLMKTGVIVTLIVSVFIGIMQSAFIYLDQGFFEKYSMLYVDQMRLEGKSAEEISLAKTAMDADSMIKTYWGTGLFYFMLTAFIGNIATFAFAMIMRKREVNSL